MNLESGRPFWPVNDGLIRPYPPLAADARCDVLVIGAGITGALAAHHLTEAGFDTVVVDRRDVASGSTAASTALLQYEIDVPLVELSEQYDQRFAERVYVACRDAIDKLGALAHRLPGDFGYEHRRSLYLGAGRNDRALFERECAARRAIGIDVELVGARELARCGIDRRIAILSHDAAEADAYAFAHALLADAERLGARVYDRTEVANIESGRNGLRIATDRGPSIHARRVVFATGFETRDFLDDDIAKLTSTYAFASEPLDPESLARLRDLILWEHARPYLYVRQTPDGRVIVGGEDESFRSPARRDRLIARKVDRLVARIGDLIPGFALEPAFAWAGTFGETKDGLAYIGPHRDWPNCYFALGYGGNGITYSLLAAEIIRDALLDRRNDCADLFAFDR